MNKKQTLIDQACKILFYGTLVYYLLEDAKVVKFFDEVKQIIDINKKEGEKKSNVK